MRQTVLTHRASSQDQTCKTREAAYWRTKLQLVCFDFNEHDFVGVQTDPVIVELAIRIDALVAVPVAVDAGSS